MLTPALACALFAAMPAPATPTAATPRLPVDAVVERVQKRYDAANDFRARFTQTLTSKTMGRKTSSAGGVMFKKPGRMRWDYDKPEKAIYVSDGGVLWLYEPEDQQAFKQELKASQLPAALAFLTGKGKLATEFDITALPRAPTAPQATTSCRCHRRCRSRP
jgi:outer membrane lipoprotein carrier protein